MARDTEGRPLVDARSLIVLTVCVAIAIGAVILKLHQAERNGLSQLRNQQIAACIQNKANSLLTVDDRLADAARERALSHKARPQTRITHLVSAREKEHVAKLLLSRTSLPEPSLARIGGLIARGPVPPDGFRNYCARAYKAS